MNSLRVIAIGNVHGCLEELQELFRVLEYNRVRDRLVFLGDLVDRGPDVPGVVRYVRALGVDVLKGNHDEKAVRWRRHEDVRRLTGKPNPMQPPDPTRREWESLSDEDIRWMDDLPWTTALAQGWIGVHAGFEPGIPLEQQRGDKMCRVRYVDINSGAMVRTEYAGHVTSGSVFWTQWAGEWKAPVHVVYGHALHSLEGPRIDQGGPNGLFYGIDTGCVFGGSLTAWIHDGARIEIVSVSAKRAYADLTGATGEL